MKPGVRALLQGQASRPRGEASMMAEALGSSLAPWASPCDSVSSSANGDQALASKWARCLVPRPQQGS